MILRKFLHSCILIESEVKRLLIDPGTFSFADGTVTPADIGPVDTLIITHEHPDHFSPEHIAQLQKRNGFALVSHRRILELAKPLNLASVEINAEQRIEANTFAIFALTAPHGPLPIPIPENLGFLINDRVFHPGDSLEFALVTAPAVLLLPIAGPWLRFTDTLEKAVAIKPHTVIPIHDWIIKDLFLMRLYDLATQRLAQANIAFKSLAPGETLEI